MAAGTKSFLASVSLIILVSICNVEAQERVTAWPPVSSDTKPWTRWWWHGSAVSKEGITSEMEAFQAVGFGGVEITPIYGVFGYEDKFINYLSPAWVEMLQHVLREAERLGLGVDMSTGTGWPFGGPWVSDDDACKTFRFKTFQLRAGDTLQEKIALAQQPLLRLVGPGTFFPLKVERRIEQRDATLELLRQIQQPVSSNKNLQALAIDQIRFERTQRLAAVLAYNGQNASVDVTHLVDSTGHLNWTPSSGTWKIYALFEGWHGKMVERAGPGGEGNVIDHFSRPAVKNYLRHFDDALADARIGGLRAFFNDSYEVDDASGAADWTPSLFEEFIRRRGYSLKEVLPALLTEEETDSSQHILCDYRQTISEMLLENFTWQWRTWAHGHGAMVRNQAHGSPANILDLYAAVDIPETEGVEPLRLRMASSAANVTGKTLVSAEAATWLNEHFRSTLSDVKSAIDGMMVNGVNHIVYHGTAYSPAEAPWPGWLFYAAVHFNQRNPIWNDLDALNTYVARCQSFLQDSRPDND
ncbi:MAG TPA: glycosyl hydrolase, partial [Chryseosolibacter sp.]|nr:glycosyl hydrolase [Chryseosolibacter sp.]